MVNNDAFDDENLYKLAVYIISLIKRFQPPIMDEKVNEWEKGYAWNNLKVNLIIQIF